VPLLGVENVGVFWVPAPLSGGGALAERAATQFLLLDRRWHVSLVQGADVGSRWDDLIDPVEDIVGKDDVHPRAAAADLVVDLMVLPVDRWHMPPLLPRMWELRENLTPYDAANVALAELTGATLVTGDERITAEPGTRCEIQIIK
jgi:hypothetical protein